MAISNVSNPHIFTPLEHDILRNSLFDVREARKEVKDNMTTISPDWVVSIITKSKLDDGRTYIDRNIALVSRVSFYTPNTWEKKVEYFAVPSRYEHATGKWKRYEDLREAITHITTKIRMGL
jgi:hypothetical protein